MKRLAATFAMTKFAGVQMIPVSAKPGGYPRRNKWEAQGVHVDAGSGLLQFS